MSTPHRESEPPGAAAGDAVAGSAVAGDAAAGSGVGQPPSGAAYPFELPPPPAAPARWRRSILLGLAAAVAVALLGAPLGLLWSALAPGVPVRQSEDGPILVDQQPEEFIAADGWFTLLALGFGLLAAMAVWWGLRRTRGPVGLVAVTLGALGAAVLAWWLGRQIGLADYQQWRATAAVGQAYLRPPDLRAGTAHLLWGFLPVVRGDLLVPAFSAAVTYTLLAGWAADSDLGAGRTPAPAGHPAAVLDGHPGPADGHPGPDAGPRPPGAFPASSGPPDQLGPGVPDQLSWGSPDQVSSGSPGQVSSGSPGQPAPPAAPGPPAPGSAAPPPG